MSKAVGFSNLSSAAGPVGLSQPQLSRIVSRLEKELQVVLLDRTAKRKSGWTPVAHRLAEVYTKSSRHMTEQIRRLSEESEPEILRLGALDGLASVAAELAQRIFSETAVRIIELDLYDLLQLEELFSKGELDLVFSGREPGRRKFKNVRTIGYQSLDEQGKGGGTRILSAYEYDLAGSAVRSYRNSQERILVSNSLFVRRSWMDRFGGRGVIPSAVRKQAEKKGKDGNVLLVAQDAFPPRLWERIEGWV